MNNIQQNVHVVNESITTNTNKRFKNFNCRNASRVVKKFLLQGFALLFLGMIGFHAATAQPAPKMLKGGSQKFLPTPTGVANEREIQLYNNTGRDMYDLKITSKIKEIKRYSIDGKLGNLAAGEFEPSAKSFHVTFTGGPVKATNPPSPLKVTLKYNASVADDSVTFIPTDSLGADILVNRSLEANSVANNNKGNPVPTSLTGGKQNVTFDPSNFCTLTYTNNTNENMHDLRISNAKTTTGQPVKIDKVFVNNTLISGPTNLNSASVHLTFPFASIPPGGSLTITIKFNTKDAVTYDLVPTNDDLGDINNKGNMKEEGPSMAVPKDEKKCAFGGEQKSNKSSYAFTNNSGQEVCGLVITCAKKINSIIVDGNVWATNPPNKKDTILQVFAGSNPCIAVNSIFSVTVILESPTATIGLFWYCAVNSNNKTILTQNVTGGVTQFLMPNSFSPIGLTSRSGSLVAINESCSPISQLVFTSPDSGVKITSASSSLPSSYNNITKKLTFNPPVASGAVIDYSFVINHLLPYSPTDTFPYTTINVNVPGVTNPLDGGAYVTASGCAGSSSGSIDFVVTKGVAPFTYLWSNGSTTEDIQNLLPGSYSVTVNSGADCMRKSFGISANQPTLEVVPISQWCAGVNDGTAIAQTDGMIAPVSYLWSNGSTDQTINFLSVGTYTVNVTDGVGCVLTGSASITPATPVSLTGSKVNLNCNQDHSGTISITAAGGTTYYNYLWNGGSTLEDRTGLAAAIYTVTVKDGFGCSVTASYNVKQPTAISPAITTTPVACAGGNNGANSSAASGGTSPYSYLWSNGNTTNAINGLTAGVYVLTISDAHGCTNVATCNVPQPPPIQVNVMPAGPNQAIANVSGGVPPYTYQWNTVPAQTTQVATGLMPNQTYMVNVHDAHNCLQTGGIIMPPNRIAFDADDFNIHVYPNPTSGILSVEIANSNAENYSLALFDATGRNVYSSTQKTDSGNQTQINLVPYENGIYLLRVFVDDKIKVIKVVLQKD